MRNTEALRYHRSYAGILEALAFFGLMVLFLVPRLPALGQFVTADEGTWGKRSAVFYYALRASEYAYTYQTGHPGVITMWAGAAAYAWKFPEFYQVGQTELGDTRLLDLFINQGRNPIDLLAAARLFIALICCAAIMSAYWFARRIFGLALSLLMFILLAFDPMHVAHSRFLHTNGLLASFMFLSLMAMIYFVERQRWFALLVSGVAAGLAIVSITPGLMLIPAAAIIMLLNLRDRKTGKRHLRASVLLRRWALPLIIWGLIALFTICLVWPSIWARPIGTLTDMVRYSFSMASGEERNLQIEDTFPNLYHPLTRKFYFYPLTYLWRSTPSALIGLILAAVFAAAGRRWLKTWLTQEQRSASVALLVFVLTYLVLMTLGAKKFDRYLLPAYPPLDILAALGWYLSARWLAEHLKPALRPVFVTSILLVVIGIQTIGTLRTFPYYNTYYNPLLGGLDRAQLYFNIGWGEGLHLAAKYLSEQPNIENKQVVSWYSLCFNWYSASYGFRTLPIEIRHEVPLERYQELDYIVIYTSQLGRDYPPDLLDYLEDMTPVYTARIQGVEFAWVYQLNPNRQ